MPSSCRDDNCQFVIRTPFPSRAHPCNFGEVFVKNLVKSEIFSCFQ